MSHSGYFNCWVLLLILLAVAGESHPGHLKQVQDDFMALSGFFFHPGISFSLTCEWFRDISDLLILQKLGETHGGHFSLYLTLLMGHGPAYQNKIRGLTREWQREPEPNQTGFRSYLCYLLAVCP